MGSRFKKSVISENVRNSLSGWKKRVRARKSSTSSSSTALLNPATSADTTSYEYDMRMINDGVLNRKKGRFLPVQDTSSTQNEASSEHKQTNSTDKLQL